MKTIPGEGGGGEVASRGYRVSTTAGQWSKIAELRAKNSILEIIEESGQPSIQSPTVEMI